MWRGDERLNDRLQTWLLVLAITAALAGLSRWWPLVTRSGALDVDVYAHGGAAVLKGLDLYALSPGLPTFTYTPFAALLFVPLGALPLVIAERSVAVLSLTSLFLAALLCVRMGLEDARVSRRLFWAGVVGLFAAALFMEPVAATLRLGQINLILLALLLVDVSGALRRVPRGVFVGLATAVKLTPGVFILYYAVTGRVKAAAVAALAFVAAALAGFALLPHASWEYWTSLVFSVDRVASPGIMHEQSLHGLLVRTRLDFAQTTVVWMAVSAAAIAAGLMLARRLSRRGRSLWAVCAVGIAGLLGSPFSWHHHWVWAVPVLAALGCEAARRRSYWLAAATIAWWWVFYKGLPGLVIMRGFGPIPRTLLRVLVYDDFVWAGLAVMIALAVWVTRTPAPTSSAGVTPAGGVSGPDQVSESTPARGAAPGG